VFWDTGIDFSVPERGKYGLDYVGMFGVLPRYLAMEGYRCAAVGEISAEALGGADALVAINPLRVPGDGELELIWRFVEGGGSVLAVGDHTGMDQVRRPLNAILAPSGISFNFDSAVPFKTLWADDFALWRSPMFAGIGGRQIQMVVGASLDTRLNAKPLIVGKAGYSDAGNAGNAADGYLGNMQFERGERIGDLILAAEARYGKGKFVAFGDTSHFQNTVLAYSYPFVDNIFAYLCGGGPGGGAGGQDGAGTLDGAGGQDGAGGPDAGAGGQDGAGEPARADRLRATGRSAMGSASEPSGRSASGSAMGSASESARESSEFASGGSGRAASVESAGELPDQGRPSVPGALGEPAAPAAPGSWNGGDPAGAGRGDFFRGFCLIDASHSEAFSRDKSGDAVDGLIACALRERLMPRMVGSGSLERALVQAIGESMLSAGAMRGAAPSEYAEPSEGAAPGAGSGSGSGAAAALPGAMQAGAGQAPGADSAPDTGSAPGAGAVPGTAAAPGAGSGFVFIIAPAVPFSGGEIAMLERFMADGGSVAICAGYGSPDAAKDLAAHFGFAFDAMPIGRVAPEQNPEMAFWDACPILFEGGHPRDGEETRSIMDIWGYSAIAEKTVGMGRLYVFGDPGFFKNKNLESVDAFRKGNVEFAAALLSGLPVPGPGLD
jgi:hypothetical protein